MSTITLTCLLEREDLPFSVEVPIDCIVANLKEAIKRRIAKFTDVATKELALWRVCISSDCLPDLVSASSPTKGILDIVAEKMELDDTVNLATVFGEGILPENINIVIQSPGVSEAEVLKMRLPAAALEYRTDRLPSSSSTRSPFGKTPGSVQLWAEFQGDSNNYVPTVSRTFPSGHFLLYDDAAYSDENMLTSIFDVNILRLLRRLVPETSYGSHRSAVVVGEPDRVLYKNRDTKDVILLIELKTPSVFDPEDLVQQYEEDSQAELQDFAPHGSCVRPVEQIYGYLSSNHLRYGVLSTYCKTWFLKRILGDLYVSPVVRHDDENPTLLRAYRYILEIAKDCPPESSPPPTPRAESLFTASSMNVGEGEESSPYTHFGQPELSSPPTPRAESLLAASSMSVEEEGSPSTHFGKWNVTQHGAMRNLASGFTLSVGDIHIPEFQWQGLLGRGRTGSVFRARWRGDIVAAKICDLYQHPKLEEEVLTEVAVYNTLSSLQGLYIPQMMCAGYFGRLFVVATRVAGDAMDLSEMSREQKLQAIKSLTQLHEFGILHGDVRSGNFLVQGSKVFLIDFGLSMRTTRMDVLQDELLRLKKLLAL